MLRLGPHEKSIYNPPTSHLSVIVLARFDGNASILHTLSIHIKKIETFSRKTSANLRFHATPSQRDIYIFSSSQDVEDLQKAGDCCVSYYGKVSLLCVSNNSSYILTRAQNSKLGFQSWVSPLVSATFVYFRKFKDLNFQELDINSFFFTFTKETWK